MTSEQLTFPPSANHSKKIATSLGWTIYSSLAGLAGVTILLVLSLANEYQEADKHAQSQAETLSRVLEEHAQAIVQKVDLVLRDAQNHAHPGDMRLRRGASGVRAAELHALLKSHVDEVPEISLLHLINAHGEHIHSSLAVPPLANLADRPYFLRQKDDAAAGLVISSPLISRATGNLTLILSRRISFEDGGFAGTVQASLDMKYFQQFYRSLSLDTHGVVALYDKELSLAARYPASEKDMGKISDIHARTFIGKGINHAVYHAKSPLDGVERIYSFRQVGNLPLFVFAGIAEDDYLAGWRRHVWQYGIGLVVFSLVVIGLGQRQRRAEEAIRENEAKFRQLFETAGDGIFIQDASGFIDCNEKGASMYGLRPADIIGRPPSDLAPERQPDGRLSADVAAEKVAAAMRGEAQKFEWRPLRSDGVIMDVDISLNRIELGGSVCLQAVVHDITERKQAEAEVYRLNAELEKRVTQRTAQLEASNKELEEFSYSMSHDMRSPMLALDGFTKILSDQYGANLDDEGKRLLKVLRVNAQRMGRMIDDILHYLRMGRLKMEFSSVDIAGLASEIFTQLQAATPSRRLRLEIGSLPHARCDRKMIREVLQNLLVNAIKFSPMDEEAVIELDGAEGEDGNVYSVTDHGIGFDMRYTDKLFRVFERVHATGLYEGSGIGLALVKRIITRHGGRVWAEGKVNEGATIYFSIPVSSITQMEVA